MDHFRRIGGRVSVPLEDAGALFSDDNPEEGAVRQDVARLLDKLPPRQRALLRDVKLTGLSMEEAAERAGMTTTAVKVSVHRGMKRLEQEVRDEDL
jgi:RNA polymerase sigma-70 factor (ECF subfamily)